uniref:aldehyde dehydrogenase family protein n=1 Tax=Rhodococcus qingshengii TaxID=334542 RepID=UPI001C4DEBFD|nr:aldehyde dehydrogenase family protein [Rhodococcus qingshengii]
MTTSSTSPNVDRRYHFIDGDWVAPTGTSIVEVENPATEEMFGQVPLGNAADVDAAVDSANTAFATWSQTSVDERGNYLRAFTDALASRREDIAQLVTMEMGTPIELSRVAQADLPISVLRAISAGLDQIEFVEKIGNSTVVREPAGVVGAITPWNYPVHQAVAKVGAALAAGCTVVLKPSEVTPLSAYLLAEAAIEAGLPAGVFNLVTGDGVGVGQALAAHPRVDVMSFTGSTRGGRAVMTTAAGTIKRVSLELGGKSANVLLPDGDLRKAVERGVEHILENSGQTCTAWTRLVVPRAQQDDVIDVVRAAFEHIVIGDPTDSATTLGPVATKVQRANVEKMIARGTDQAARVAAGNTDTWSGRGHYVNPVVFADVESAMDIAQEEIFGPVLSILPYDDEQDALRIANDSIYGLSGAVWSADEDRASAFARRMRTGMVSVNGGSFNTAAPFGGYKQSGFGREFGRYGIEDFLEIKAMQY